MQSAVTSTSGRRPRRRRFGPVDTDALWRDYKADGDTTARDALVEHYADLVNVVAKKLSNGLPPNVELGDLVSYGLVGLFDAVTKYEPERGWKFETYATQRIRGAILDELRAIDWVPRSVRMRARQLAAAVGKLEGRLGRSPTEAELAAEMRLTIEDVRDIRNDTNWATMSSSVAPSADSSEDGPSPTHIVDTLPDTFEAVESVWELEELTLRLSEAMSRLRGRELVVAQLYYIEGLTLAEIGTHLGVTESRVCQLHTKATEHLRTLLSDEKA